MVDNKWHEYVKLNIDFHAVEFKRSENCIKKKKRQIKFLPKQEVHQLPPLNNKIR